MHLAALFPNSTFVGYDISCRALRYETATLMTCCFTLPGCCYAVAGSASYPTLIPPKKHITDTDSPSCVCVFARWLAMQCCQGACC